MMKQPLSMILQLVLGNPLVEMAFAALPDPLRTEVQELRRLALSGDLSFRPRELREGDVDGERVRGLGLCLGDVRSGQVRGVNILRGTVHGGTVRGVNLLQGDVAGGDVAAVNVLVGAVRGGTLKAVNLILGEIHDGSVTRANLVVGDVHGGHLEAAVLLGDIHGGAVTVGYHHGVRHTSDTPGGPTPDPAPADSSDGTD